MNAAVEKLRDYYEDKRQEAEIFAMKPDASDFILSKKNDELKMLNSILNEFDKFSYDELWLKVEAAIDEIRQLDSELGSVQVILDFNNKKKHYGRLFFDFN